MRHVQDAYPRHNNELRELTIRISLPHDDAPANQLADRSNA